MRLCSTFQSKNLCDGVCASVSAAEGGLNSCSANRLSIRAEICSRNKLQRESQRLDGWNKKRGGDTPIQYSVSSAKKLKTFLRCSIFKRNTKKKDFHIQFILARYRNQGGYKPAFVLSKIRHAPNPSQGSL